MENYTVTKVYVFDEELELQHRINKDKMVKVYSVTVLSNSNFLDSKSFIFCTIHLK